MSRQPQHGSSGQTVSVWLAFMLVGRAAYITLWGRDQLERARASQDQTLDYSAGRQFRARGVAPGDRVYVLALSGQRLLLVGRLTVTRVVDQAEAERTLPGRTDWAPDHLLGHGTPISFENAIPLDMVGQIRRESGKLEDGSLHGDGRSKVARRHGADH